VPVSALKPPFKGVRKKEMERIASQLLFPVTVEGDRQYYISIHAGKLLEPQVGTLLTWSMHSLLLCSLSLVGASLLHALQALKGQTRDNEHSC